MTADGIDLQISFEPDPELAGRIADFQIGPQDVDLTFDKRLMRECLWTAEFVERVATEYRRFLYLMVISEQELTPSEAVDAAWHLHLSYTRSYWDEFCGEVLQGRPLHHGPTKGGAGEEDRFRKAYACTLSLYRQVFGKRPPADIWPTVDQRFARGEDMRTVSAADYYLMRRPPPAVERALAGVLACAAAVWAFVGPFHLLLPDFPPARVVDFVAGAVVALIFGSFAMTGKWPKVTVGSSSGCGGCGCGG